MASIRDRLAYLQAQYSLTIADLSHLLGCDSSTVRTWLNGVEPMGTKLGLLEEKMAAIVKARKHFPVPLSVTQFQRKQYLLDAINGRPSKLSGKNTTT